MKIHGASIRKRCKITSYDHRKHFHLPPVIMDEIKPIFRSLSDPELLRRCLLEKSQNINESLNNVIWSRLPKRTFVNLSTLRFGTFEAVLSFNDGGISKCKIFEQLGLKVGRYLIAAKKQQDEERVRKAEKNVAEIEKKKIRQ